MAQVSKIDSNITGLAYAKESTLGTLPVSPAWYRLEPNSYNDFGGNVTKVAPNPINPSRQRKKGVTTDLEAAGGFNHNLSFYNLQDLMTSFMFAAFRKKGSEIVTAVSLDTSNDDEYEVSNTAGFLQGSLIKGFNFTNSANNALNTVTAVVSNTSVDVADGQLVAESSPPSDAYIQVVGHVGSAGDIDVDVSGDLPKLTSTALNFTTLGLVVGQWIFIGGDTASTKFSNAVNNGFKRVRSISANAIVIDKSVSDMVAESSTTQTIQLFFGDVIKNETGSNIVRTSFHLERTLGVPDDASPSQVHTEYLKGAVVNEMTLNIPTANLVNADFTFLATNHLQRTGSEGPIQTSVSSPQASDIFNTTSDFSRIKMAVVSSTDENTDDLFAYITEATITVNNNLSYNKAVGVLGAFDISSGTFTVGGSLTAYFSNVSAIQAVRNNSDITLDFAMVKGNQGIVLDIPLASLGDARLNVEQDQPITIPLSLDAATGEDIAAGMDHTLLFTLFGYLPNAAD